VDVDVPDRAVVPEGLDPELRGVLDQPVGHHQCALVHYVCGYSTDLRDRVVRGVPPAVVPGVQVSVPTGVEVEIVELFVEGLVHRAHDRVHLAQGGTVGHRTAREDHRFGVEGVLALLVDQVHVDHVACGGDVVDGVALAGEAVSGILALGGPVHDRDGRGVADGRGGFALVVAHHVVPGP